LEGQQRSNLGKLSLVQGLGLQYRFLVKRSLRTIWWWTIIFRLSGLLPPLGKRLDLVKLQSRQANLTLVKARCRYHKQWSRWT